MGPEAAGRWLMNNYSRAPIVLVRGEGARVWDEEGRAYLDFLAGISVNNLGHCHPRVVEAIRRQAGELLHCSNLYHSLPQSRLAEALAALAGGGHTFFCQSGAEAVEAAIKLARKRYWRRRQGAAGPAGPVPDPEILTFTGAFHGRTMGALAATGKYTAGFEPLLPGFRQLPFNDLQAAEAAVGPATCAILVEPVQGEGGVHPADPVFLAGLRRLAGAAGALLIFDEIQCGLGRTGKLFAYQHYGVEPDVIILAKALGAGLPAGALLALGEAADVLQPGDHGSTFGGNPVAMAAGLAALDVLLADDLSGRAARVGAYLRHKLEEVAARHRSVREVRGLGLMQGLELSLPARPVVDACREGGLLCGATAERVVRLLPPLIIGEAEVDEAVAIVDAGLNSVESAAGV